MKFLTIFIISLVAFATLFSSVNGESRAEIRKKNAKDAQALQDKFDKFTPNTKCKSGENACINGFFAKCTTVQEGTEFKDKFVLFDCGKKNGVQCFVLPLVLKRGTSITCDTKKDRDARFFQAEHNL